MDIRKIDERQSFGHMIINQRNVVMKCLPKADRQKLIKLEKEFQSYRTMLYINPELSKGDKFEISAMIIHKNDIFSGLHDFKIDTNNNKLKCTARDVERKKEVMGIHNGTSHEQNSSIEVDITAEEQSKLQKDFNFIDAVATLFRKLEK